MDEGQDSSDSGGLEIVLQEFAHGDFQKCFELYECWQKCISANGSTLKASLSLRHDSFVTELTKLPHLFTA
jgi:hypothetical protein